jgi:hypothetical protein
VEGIEGPGRPSVQALALQAATKKHRSKKKWKKRKNLLAMTIYSDTNDGVGLSLSTSLHYETTRNRCLYSNFERFFGSAVSGRDLPI